MGYLLFWYEHNCSVWQKVSISGCCLLSRQDRPTASLHYLTGSRVSLCSTESILQLTFLLFALFYDSRTTRMIQGSSDDLCPKHRILRALKIRDISRHVITSFVDSYNKFCPLPPSPPQIIRFQEGNKDSVDEKYNSGLKDWQKQDDRAFP